MKHGTPVIPNPFFAIIPTPIPTESGRVTRQTGRFEPTATRVCTRGYDALMP